MEHALEEKRSEYIQASSSSYSLVSSKFAAYVYVEMERARLELEDHRSACKGSIKVPAALPVLPALCLTPPDRLQSNPVGAAA